MVQSRPPVVAKGTGVYAPTRKLGVLPYAVARLTEMRLDAGDYEKHILWRSEANRSAQTGLIPNGLKPDSREDSQRAKSLNLWRQVWEDVAMGAAIGLRADFDGTTLRRLARKTKNAHQSRRLLALAEIYDGSRRSNAARIGGVGLQLVR